MRIVVMTACAVVWAAGCTAILGIDKDYTVDAVGGGGSGTVGGGGTTSTGGATTTGSGGGAAGQGGSPTGSGTGTGGTGGALETVVYTATVADCIDTSAPDPDQCASPAEALWIDLPETEAYLRFEPDSTIAGATVVSASLRLTVGTYSQAQGDTSGELWEVTPFSRTDLFSAAPSATGSVLAPDQGAADPGASIDWPLPVGLIAAGTPVYLGLFPTSHNSVGYLNLNSGDPPRLIVEIQ